MSFLDLFRRKKKPNNVTVEENIQPVVLTDPKAINHYVIELCEQMIDISKEMEEVRQEYENVTAYFNDVSIVEGLEGEQKELLVDVATNVSKLAKARNDYLNAEHKISDEMFSLLDDNEAEMPGIIKRLQANETYLDAIKRDMNRLSGEKIEWSVLRQECEKEQKTLRKMSYTMLYVFGTIAIIVAMLSLTFRWDLFPLMVVAFLATVAGSYIVLRMQDRAKEIKKCDMNLNHAIALENRVKIKFVNIKNAIDYTCERFHVNNSMELTYNYEQYIEACKEREKFRQNSEDLEYFNSSTTANTFTSDESDYEAFYVFKLFEKISKKVLVKVREDKPPIYIIYTKPPCLNYLSDQTKINFLANVNRSSRNTKLIELMEQTEYFKIEAEYNFKKLRDKPKVTIIPFETS